MTSPDLIHFQFLGQAGILLYASNTFLAVDPYLSNSVAEKYGCEFDRQIPVPIRPDELRNLQWICLTHSHLDHADPATLLPLSVAAHQALFIAPPDVIELLISNGIPDTRIRLASEQWTNIAPQIDIRAVPAAHMSVERDSIGHLHCCGYLFKFGHTLIYHSGDTMPHQEIVSSLLSEGDIDIAFLPCNERNVYRERADILGNMSIREMLAFATELRAKNVVAIHWDMFAPNSVIPEEILTVSKHTVPHLSVLVPRCGSKYDLGLNEII